MREVDWRSMALWLIVAVFSTGGVAGLFLYMRAIQTRKEPIVVAYGHLCAKLAKSGIARGPHEGPLDYWRRLQVLRPDIAQQVEPLFESYVALRYAADVVGESASVRAFVWRVRRLRLSDH